MSSISGYATQNQLLLNNLLTFYSKENRLDTILPIINGNSRISLRLIDWFVSNHSKKNFIVYNITTVNPKTNIESIKRFKVHIDYKLKLKAYSKKRFDPFCRWERITIPYKDNTYIQTTLGQLNFFKWALENKIIEYIEQHFTEIEDDMNKRNSTSRKKSLKNSQSQSQSQELFQCHKTRKKREELSISAVKCIKKEDVEIVVKFD